jgi:hypothetical protein
MKRACGLAGLLAKDCSLGLSGLWWPGWPGWQGAFLGGLRWPVLLLGGLCWPVSARLQMQARCSSLPSLTLGAPKNPCFFILAIVANLANSQAG